MRGRGFSMAAAAVVLALVGGGCGKKTDNGFAVALTVIVDPSVSDAALGQVKTLNLAVTGAETFNHSFPVTTELGSREGKIIYRPVKTSGKLDFAVSLGDAGSVILGSGSVTGVDLVAGKTTAATVHVGGGAVVLDMSGPPPDLAGVADLTTVGDAAVGDAPVALPDQVVVADQTTFTDLFGVDLNGADLKPPPDLKPPADLVVVADLAVATPDMAVPQDLASPASDLVVVPPLFGKPIPATVGKGPTGIAAGDFNGDLHPDLVVTNTKDGAIQSLLYNKVTTLFIPQAQIPFGLAFPAPTVVATGTFGSNDLFVDVVVGSNTQGTLMYLQGNNVGGFTVSNNRSVGSPVFALAVGDLEGSGKPANVVTAQGSQVQVYSVNNCCLSQRDTLPLTMTMNAFGVGLGEFNGDGNLDVALGGFTIATNSGTGNLNLANTQNVSPSTPSTVVADFDRDGKVNDIAFIDPVNDFLYVYLETIQVPPTFVQATRIPITKSGFMMVAGDFNLDGAIDLAITHRITNEIGIYLNDTKGRFTAGPLLQACPLGLSPGIHSIVAGDWNLDSRIDLAVTCEGNDSVSVLLHN